MFNRNDLIEKFIADEAYTITEDGVVMSVLNNKKVGHMSNGSLATSYLGRSIAIHRIIYRKYHGELIKGHLVCHINGNNTDNRPENLKQVPSCAQSKIIMNNKMSNIKIDRLSVASYGVIKNKKGKYLRAEDVVKALGIIRDSPESPYELIATLLSKVS